MSNGFYFFLGCLAGLLVAALWRYVNRNTRRVNKWSWMARKRWYKFYQDDFHEDQRHCRDDIWNEKE